MNTQVSRVTRTFATLALLCLTAPLPAQDTSADEPRTTGLPKDVDWTFNLDAGVGAFGFNNSLYTNQRPDPSGDLSDNWLESYVKPALTGELGRQGGSVFFGKVSGVGARTFSAPPSIVGESASSFQVEDAYLGWRSGTSSGLGEDAFEIMLGRAPYTLGHGFLLWDGAGDGGSRGGFWSGPRKAWEYAAIGRFEAKGNTFEVFYLDRDEVPESDTDSKVWGANYELAIGEHSTFGLTYLSTQSDIDSVPGRDGMDVYDLRAFTAPIRALPGLAFELEYAFEDNGDVLESSAWAAQVGYTLELTWSPQLSYRYAFFEGDDPATEEDEAFDSLFPGFYDWGTWWQGEIGGEYFLSNSNLISHQVRLHLEPTEAIGWGVILYQFQLDQPASFGAGVTSDDVAVEIDGYVDWKINDNFTTSFVLAYADPDDAIAQGFSRTDSLSYGMVYVSYAY
jgi:hypothetical protein